MGIEDMNSFYKTNAPEGGEQKEKTPDMYENGGEYHGKNFQGIDFGIDMPRGSGSWKFKIDASNEANQEALNLVREILDKRAGGSELLKDSRERDSYVFRKGDPRGFIREVLDEALKSFNEKEKK